jgi:hypothetical protein
MAIKKQLPKCKSCRKSICKNQNSIFCDVGLHWLHLKCSRLTKYNFISLANESDDITWCCWFCLNEALPFHDCSDTDLVLESDHHTVPTKTDFDPDNLNQLFSDLESSHDTDDENENTTIQNLTITSKYITSHNINSIL